MAKKTVELELFAPKARKVNLAGTFNNWDMSGMTAKKDRQGKWSVRLSLNPGRYEYKFVVDGSWITDPKSKATAPNTFGSANSVLEIK